MSLVPSEVAVDIVGGWIHTMMLQVRILHALEHPNVLKFYAWCAVAKDVSIYSSFVFFPTSTITKFEIQVDFFYSFLMITIHCIRYETSAHLWLVLEYCVGGDLLSLLRQVQEAVRANGGNGVGLDMMVVVVLALGGAVTITVSKEGVTFSTRGDIGSGNTTFRQNTTIEKPEVAVIVEMKEPVVLTFALKYMTTFAKATSLSRYYLAPKIEEEDLETNTQPETTIRRETRTETRAEPQEEAMPLAIIGTKEENGVEDEVVEDSQVKMETETEAEMKPKVEKKSVKAEVIAVEDECMMETEFGEEIKPEVDATEPKAKIEVMEIQ